MKILNKLMVGAGLCVFALSSCVGDLDTQPLTHTTILPEEAWSDPNAYELFTAKIYSAFAIPGSDGPASGDIVGADQGEATFTRSMWNLEELPTDEALVAWSDEGLNGLNFVQWTPTNRFVMLNYDRLELINAYCNEFLIQTTPDKLSSRNLTAEQIEAANVNRAEVRALRAYSYYVLMNFYGNVPFTDESSGIGAYMPEQKGRDFLFPWIEKELKDVINSLPAKSVAGYGKVNRYVADMILANLYINAEVYGQGNHYSDAAACLADIIDNGGYALEPTYKFNFQADNDLSPEMIFPIIYDGVYAQSYGGTTYLCAGAYGDDMAPGDNYGLPQYWSGIRAPHDLSQLFEEGDSRARFFTENRSQEIFEWNDFKQGYSVVKFTNLTRDGGSGKDNTFPDTDFPLYRLADTYLLYVECALRGAGNADATKAILCYNRIQERAYGNTSHNINSLGDLSLDKLLDERARELYWEAHRRTDLIRFNRFIDGKSWSWKNGSFVGSERIDAKYLLYPLPSTDLSANSNLVQNPGY